MLERIRVIRNELTLAISKCEKAPPNLSAEEYKMLEEIEKMLEPFEVATNFGIWGGVPFSVYYIAYNKGFVSKTCGIGENKFK